MLHKCSASRSRGGQVHPREGIHRPPRNFQVDLDAIESGWLDISKGMSRLKRVEYERNKTEDASANADGTNIASALRPNDPKAYTFNKVNSVTSVIRNNNATVWSSNESATLGATVYLPDDDDSSLHSMVDGAFEDYDTGNEEDDSMKISGMGNVTRGGGEEGKTSPRLTRGGRHLKTIQGWQIRRRRRMRTRWNPRRRMCKPRQGTPKQKALPRRTMWRKQGG